jgi:thiol peroxidase
VAKITLKGNPINTCGNLPAVGTKAPDFVLTRGDLSNVSLADFKGKKKIINIVPSLDTPVCANSMRQFNSKASEAPNTVVLTVSRDLPFAQKRFCETEGIANVVALAELRGRDFGRTYGVEITDGPLAGVLGRGIVVLDETDEVIHTELVPEIAQEPDYEAALKAVKG